MKIEGVLYKFVVKGIRRRDNYDGLYKQGSHLIYGWLKLSTTESEFPEWAWAYEWEDETGKTQRLGRGWQKKPIWRDYPGGVKQWIEDLAANRVFPRHIDALASVFPQALPVERRADEVESWKRQIVAQEQGVELCLEAVKEMGYTQEALDRYFPQYSHSCESFSGCPFRPICWEGIKPEPGDLYQIRVQNHPEVHDED